MNLLICLVLISFSVSNAQYDGDECTVSHNQKTGICKNSRFCPEIIQAYKQGIRFATCSYSGGIHYVCCPSEASLVQTTTTRSFPTNLSGRVSARKCEEYKSRVKARTPVGGLTTNPKLHEISADTCDVSTGLIVGGTKTNNGEFPHTVAIGNGKVGMKSMEFICGGSLISNQFVLTAAHCKRSKNLFARLGDQNINSSSDGLNEVDIDIVQFIKHDQYKPATKANDIALAKLSRAVEFTNYIRPACLWQNYNINSKTVVATGWGFTEHAGTSSDELLKVQLSILSNKICADAYNDASSVDERYQLCVGDLTSGKDTCQGDSGGPVQIVLPNDKCTYHIVGITSFGGYCGGKNSASVYTRVSSYLDWIEQNVW